MPVRNRRVRLLAFVVFAALVLLLYSRSSDTVEGYTDYVKEKTVGGGAVIRPKPEDSFARPSTVPEPRPEEKPGEKQDLFQPPPAPSTSELATTKTSSTTSETTLSKAAPATTSAPAGQPAQAQPPPEDATAYQVGEGRVEVELEASATTNIIHWTKQPEHFPISSTIQLPKGTSKPMPRIQRAVKKLSENGADQDRLASVKAAAQHAWKGYREFAFPQDEIRPISQYANNPFNGWGATMVDGLDTLWIMGMKDEFEEAVEAVAKIDFTTSPRSDIPLFETVIRYLGGLVAAYDVSGRKHRVLLDKAVELAEVLYSAFDTPNRVPLTYYRWKPSFASQPHRASNRVILAEIGTLSMEFTRLAQIIGEPKYYDAIARITDMFEEWQNSTRLPGMWPTTFDGSGCGKPQVQSTQTQNQQPVPEGPQQQNAPGAVTEAERKNDLDAKPNNKNSARPDVRILEDEDDEEFDTNVKAKLLNSPREPSDQEIESESQSKHSKRTPPNMPEAPKLNSDEICVQQGLRSTSKNTHETFTLSGASDSMYEYLPKEYLLLGGQVDSYRTMYLDSAATAIERLLYKPMTKDERDILMSGELKIQPNYSQPMETREYIEKFNPEAAHLACFAGGMFALGGVIFDKPEHVTIGSKLTDGCVWAYNVTATGIMPEGATVMPCPDTWGECPWNETAYWQELDPYEHTRTGPQDTAPHISKPDPGSPLQRVRPEPSVDLNKRNDMHAEGTSIAKRQLEEEASPAEPSLEEPHPPEPFASPQAAQPPTPVTSSEVDEPVYTPPPPLTHQEFVEKKIEDERLPPGYLRINGRRYILRPEAIESVFYMYRITGDPYWRDVGWNMFTSIDRHTRAPHGNSAIDDITKAAPELLDQMESFWLAETLKYFYLLYDEPDTWSLDEWVLNTEAHLFRRPAYEFLEA